MVLAYFTIISSVSIIGFLIRLSPQWLKAAIPAGENYFKIKKNLESRNLSTICRQARCPNISRCWNNFHATFLIMGDTCSRNCSFCSVKTGKPSPLLPEEGERLLEMVDLMKTKYLVITSVTRDDLEDGGSTHFAGVITKLKTHKPGVKIEVLVPDFKGNTRHLDTVLDANPDVLNHNLETVRRLYPHVNRRIENYHVSLGVLRCSHKKGFIAKSGIMLGLGETDDQVRAALRALRSAGVDRVTLGQYLKPARGLAPVDRYVSPERFAEWEAEARDIGFKWVKAGPKVRSSYHAEMQLD